MIQNWINKYGKVNLFILSTCVVVYILNLFTIDNLTFRDVLWSDKGALMESGWMSYLTFYQKGEWFRCITSLYLHAGCIHLIFNMIALLCVGSYLEKRMGSIRYYLCFHLVGMIEAMIGAYLIAQEVSVGASSGIFGCIGMGIVYLFKYKDGKEMSRSHWIYICFYILSSLCLGISSFVHHFVALILGIIIKVTER